MTLLEKIYSLCAVCLLAALAALLITVEQTRTPVMLLSLSFVGMVTTVGLLFIVFRDIMLRPFPTPSSRYVWMLLIFFFLPSVLVYLPVYGFKPR